MKIGIHLSTFTKNWDEDVFQHVKTAKEIGFSSVEFPLINPFDFDVRLAKSILDMNDISCTCCSGLNINADISSLDNQVRDNGIAFIKKCLEISHDLDSTILAGVLYAPWGVTTPRWKMENCIKNSTRALHHLGEYAKSLNVTIALEIINRYETYFMNTVEEGLKILELIDSEAVGLHFDTFHANIEEKDSFKALEKGGKHIKHIHFCENDRGTPLTGQVNWKNIIKGIRKINYDGHVVLENFVIPNCEVGDNTFIYREIEDSGFEAAKNGYEAMYKLLEIYYKGEIMEKEINIKKMLINVADFYIEHMEELSKLDAVIGDGDHGISMAKGAKKGKQVLTEMDDGLLPHEYFTIYGRTLVGEIGGAMGPLFGTIFMEIGKSLKDSQHFNATDFQNGLAISIEKIIKLGGAKEGDKTMLDAMIPSLENTKTSIKENASLVEVLIQAEKGAYKGVLATINMHAKSGRSKYAGEKSVGCQDAGATSFYYLIKIMREFVEKG